MDGSSPGGQQPKPGRPLSPGGLYVPSGMSFGCPASMSIPERITGLAPCSLSLSESSDLVSGLPVELLRLGARLSGTDRRPSSPLEAGRSSFLITTLFSYGLKASLAGSEGGVVRLVVLELTRPPPAGLGPGRGASLIDVDFFFSKVGKRALGVGESAPIWLQVCASKARGLFLASSCKRKEINS